MLQVITKQRLDAAGQVQAQEITHIREAVQRPTGSGAHQYATGRWVGFPADNAAAFIPSQSPLLSCLCKRLAVLARALWQYAAWLLSYTCRLASCTWHHQAGKQFTTLHILAVLLLWLRSGHQGADQDGWQRPSVPPARYQALEHRITQQQRCWRCASSSAAGGR
jgi:hypothetical protein